MAFDGGYQPSPEEIRGANLLYGPFTTKGLDNVTFNAAREKAHANFQHYLAKSMPKSRARLDHIAMRENEGARPRFWIDPLANWSAHNGATPLDIMDLIATKNSRTGIRPPGYRNFGIPKKPSTSSAIREQQSRDRTIEYDRNVAHSRRRMLVYGVDRPVHPTMSFRSAQFYNE